MVRYLNFGEKYRLLKTFSNIFSIKAGKIFKSKSGECFKVKKWFSFLYTIYLASLSTELVLIPILFGYMFVSHFIDIWWLNLLTCALLYVIIEVVFIALVPLEKVPCWEMSLEEKKVKGL